MSPATRTAREVVELYNLVVWNERNLDLAEELFGDSVIRHEVGEAQTLTHAQAVQRVADIAYLVSQGLPTEVRRGHDEHLVREYLVRLAEGGVVDYSFDEAWQHYRFAVAYLMLLPVITLVGWATMPERSRALCLKLTERAVAAIHDLDATEVFA